MVRTWYALGIACFFSASNGFCAEFRSQFQNAPDRIWVGPDCWANPTEDWYIQDGWLTCMSNAANRNVALLTHDLDAALEPFVLRVMVRLFAGTSKKQQGAVGFRVGCKDEIEDYRAIALRGRGLECGVTSEGVLFLDAKPAIGTVSPEGQDKSLVGSEWEMVLEGVPQNAGTYQLKLSLIDQKIHKAKATLTKDQVPARRLAGGVALICNPPKIVDRGSRGMRFSFREWRVAGDKVRFHPERAWGPILWSMHTLSDSRREDGFVLKMTAQMPPLGKKDSETIFLEMQAKGEWQTLGESPIDPNAGTATFRVTHWKASRDVPYRLVYELLDRDGKEKKYTYEGTVRKNPTDQSVIVAGFTGNMDYVFPNLEICRNLRIHDPDVLFFSGDQIYEQVGGYGIIREPADRSILNYLRKWYLLGWAFGDLMRDRVTVCLPDDHDVYQGNLWGEGGRDCGGIRGHAAGGYAQPVAMVNAVHRAQTSHHPDLFDPTPIERGISVYYGDMVYGRVSFAIIADRQFKSGPEGKVNTWEGRPDHVKSPDIDVSSLDKPGLKLLGDRQLSFLEQWAADWRGAEMKMLLSQTIFCNVANYHGAQQEFIIADLDSNGWPQSGRRRALEAMRKGFALHLAGDQHLPSIVWHGLDAFRDAGWSFCVPSIAAGYPRSWRPDQEGRPVQNRPDPRLPNTGDYLDGFGNKVTVYAVGNPEKKNRPGAVNTAHDKASGYGLVRMDLDEATYTLECWRIQVDVDHPKEGDQFPGWPRTIRMRENYGRAAVGWLPTVEVFGRKNPVVQVIHEASGEVEYTIRIRGSEFSPKVYQKDTHTLKVGEPDVDEWRVFTGLMPAEGPNIKVIGVKFD